MLEAKRLPFRAEANDIDAVVAVDAKLDETLGVKSMLVVVVEEHPLPRLHSTVDLLAVVSFVDDAQPRLAV